MFQTRTMASLSTPDLRSSPLIYRKIAQSSTKLILPAKCSIIRSCANISRNLSSDYQVNNKRTSKATEIRVVATLDTTPSAEQDAPVARGHDMVNGIEDPIEYIRTLLSTTGDGRYA